MKDKPHDPTNSKNPWLMNKVNRTPIIGPEGKPLTAEYVWSKCGREREDLAQWVFNYYRKNGFPLPKLSDTELKKEFEKLKAKNSADILKNGTIINSNTIGLKISKHFSGELFFRSRGGQKTKSCVDVFDDDDLFMRVIKNRMGWKTTKEGGVERPYIFAIDDAMIIQGMRSSGLSYSVSHFRPLIAKFIYERYNVKSVLDYSCGWGDRALGALSLGAKYYGIDPLTAEKVNDILDYFGADRTVIKGGSENFNNYLNCPYVDLAFSSPPYFDLEIYDDGPLQSSNHKNYDDWLEYYWRPTVKNCYTSAKKFGFVAVEQVKKNKLLEDMRSVCKEEGGKKVEEFPIKTSTSHLSNKSKTGRVNKKTEWISIYEV